MADLFLLTDAQFVAVWECSILSIETSASVAPSLSTKSQKSTKSITIENRPYGGRPSIGARITNKISRRTCWVVPGDRGLRREGATNSGVRLVDWIYVDDVVDGLIGCAQTPGIDGGAVELGSGQLSETLCTS